MDKAQSFRPADSTYSTAVADGTDYTDWILSLFGAVLHDPVLEIGVGHGSYSERLAARPGYCGIDIDPIAVEEARRRHPEARFEVADISDGEAIRKIGTGFRTVLCFNVLEHVVADRDALALLAECLAPNGRLFLFVPAHPLLFNDLDRLAGHHRRYTRESLSELATGLPMALRRADYVNPIGGLGWFANRSVRHDDLNGELADRQIRLFMRYLLPVSKAATLVTRGFFGQSLVIEFERL